MGGASVQYHILYVDDKEFTPSIRQMEELIRLFGRHSVSVNHYPDADVAEEIWKEFKDISISYKEWGDREHERLMSPVFERLREIWKERNLHKDGYHNFSQLLKYKVNTKKRGVTLGIRSNFNYFVEKRVRSIMKKGGIVRKVHVGHDKMERKTLTKEEIRDEVSEGDWIRGELFYPPTGGTMELYQKPYNIHVSINSKFIVCRYYDSFIDVEEQKDLLDDIELLLRRKLKFATYYDYF
ncbi:MAG: hypothetical protein ACFFCS_20380 [Candidatus Hodarchaeota archaeon]